MKDPKAIGHGDTSQAPPVKKGSFKQVGSYTPQGPTVSVNSKTGVALGDEKTS